MINNDASSNSHRPAEAEPPKREPTHADCVRAFELYSRGLYDWTMPGSQQRTDALLMGETLEDLPFYFNMDHA